MWVDPRSIIARCNKTKYLPKDVPIGGALEIGYPAPRCYLITHIQKGLHVLRHYRVFCNNYLIITQLTTLKLDRGTIYFNLELI